MNILSFMGSPRLNGNTDILLDHILKGAKLKGANVKKIKLITLKYRGCIECGECENNGICSLKDDFSPFYKDIISSDVIIIASPIFFYNITSLTQMVIERAQALWIAKYRLTKAINNQSKQSKIGIFVSVGATKGQRLFEGANLVVRYFFDAIGVKKVSSFLVKGVEKKGNILKQKELLDDAIKFGEEIFESNLRDRLIVL